MAQPQFPELFQDQTVTIPSSDLGPELTFQTERSVGSGSFGVVFRARSQDGQHLAIKKVFQDRRYRNRELQVIQQLHPHEFIVKTVNYYFSTANSQQNGYYLNLIMQYYPENAYQVYRGFARNGKKLPLSDIKLYTYQFLRGLAWMHCFQVTNRDLKPQNTLIDRQSGRAVLCDLGSAKQLNPQEPNIAYICSRYYRAPELVFGSRFYSCVIDVWSFACVVAEMMIGRPLFPGQSPIDQLVEIIKVLGPPSLVDLKNMNPQLREYNFPTIQTTPLEQVLGTNDPVILDFFKNCLRYSPGLRFTCFQALQHEFFDEALPVQPDGGGPGPHPGGRGGREQAQEREGVNVAFHLLPGSGPAACVLPLLYSTPLHSTLALGTGVIVKGCNVENAVSPNGACAEKTAIGTAVAQGHRNIVAVAIVTRDSGLPCGSCRQVLNEFGADMWCIMLNGAGEVTMEMPLTQVLPHAFGPKNLL